MLVTPFFEGLNKNSGAVLGGMLGLTGRNCVLFGVGGLTKPLLRLLLLMGVNVVASRRNPDKLAKDAEEIKPFAWTEAQFRTMAADVNHQDQIAAVCQLGVDSFGQLDLGVFAPGSIVTNANAKHGHSPTQVELSQVLAQIGADFGGGLRFAQCIEPHFRSANECGVRPRLVFMSSIGPGRPGGPPTTASVGYNGAKGALRVLAAMLAASWAQFCSVNEVAPGPVVTELNEQRMGPKTQRGSTALQNTPTGQLILPTDPAGAFLYLLSPVLNGGVIGQTIVVDNGLTMNPAY